MARKLAYTVHVSQKAPVDPDQPDGDQYEVKSEMFERGSELPEWAATLVGDHVYEPEDPTLPEVAPNGAADGRGPGAPEGSEDGAPKGNASLEAWQEYARSQGASDGDLEDKSRDDLRDLYGSN